MSRFFDLLRAAVHLGAARTRRLTTTAEPHRRPRHQATTTGETQRQRAELRPPPGQDADQPGPAEGAAPARTGNGGPLQDAAEQRRRRRQMARMNATAGSLPPPARAQRPPGRPPARQRHDRPQDGRRQPTQRLRGPRPPTKRAPGPGQDPARPLPGVRTRTRTPPGGHRDPRRPLPGVRTPTRTPPRGATGTPGGPWSSAPSSSGASTTSRRRAGPSGFTIVTEPRVVPGEGWRAGLTPHRGHRRRRAVALEGHGVPPLGGGSAGTARTGPRTGRGPLA